MDERRALWQAPPTGPAPGIRYANALERSLATLIDYGLPCRSVARSDRRPTR